MDFPQFKIVKVPIDLRGKEHIIKLFDRKLVLIHDAGFEGHFKEGIIFNSGESDDTYILFDPVSNKRISLEYTDLKGLLVRI